MSADRINGEQYATVEWGGSPATDRLDERLDWLGSDRPAVRGAGIGCAVAGFGLLIAAELLPWMSMPSSASPLVPDVPPTSTSRVEIGLAQLSVPTEMFSLGWLAVLAAVAVALVVRPQVRRVMVAAGLGLVAGELALLVGITNGIEHTTSSGVFRGAFVSAPVPTAVEPGLYCAYAAVGLFALALLLAGGVPRRITDATAVPEETDDGPADLTVTPVHVPDQRAWARHEPDIDVNGRRPDR